MKTAKFFLLLTVLLLVSGFDFSRRSIPLGEIQSGGPPKDGIPALTAPRFVKADEADFLKPDDKVIGLYLEGEARAYPVRILNWHEAVNDVVGSTPVLVTW